MEQKSNKTIVLECYRKIVRDLDISLVDRYIKEDYIQHSPTIKSGRTGLLEMLTFLKTLPKPAEIMPSPIVRVIADGNFVAVHLDVRFMGKRMAVIDLYRLENGKLAEHWDALQLQPEYENNLITMTNGSTIIEDTADRDENKRLIRKFFEEVILSLNSAALGNWLTPHFIEHSTVTGLLKRQGEEIKVHKVIGEGNFILTHCACKRGDNTFARYDIFKMEDTKIAEHWRVEQEVPDIMAHGNGMF
jgi:predicted SnoaL-like aldol condensation-catalyzing enzyme